MTPSRRSRSLPSPAATAAIAAEDLDPSSADVLMPQSQSLDVSQIVFIESRFSPSCEKDCVYDGIVSYLRSRSYPPFLKLTSNPQAAKVEFRRKCGSFFIDIHGELVKGRASGLHRHVLRRGELTAVMKFVHEVLGHCNAEVCVKVTHPVVWSSEPFDITAYSVIKQCECRDKGVSRRWFPCTVECVKYIALIFVREANGGYLLSLRSVSDKVDLGQFQITVPKYTKPKPKVREVLMDGKHRIADRRELEDVLTKLHMAFGHCSANSLRILFKSKFHYPAFFMAAREVCYRCWFCKLEPHRKHFIIPDYGYDVEIELTNGNSTRNFVINPRDVTAGKVARYITEILEDARNNLCLESAAVIADGAGLTLEPREETFSCDNISTSSVWSTGQTVAPDRLNPTVHSRRNKINNRKSSPHTELPIRARLIPPSDISLGPTSALEARNTDSFVSRSSQRSSCSLVSREHSHINHRMRNNSTMKNSDLPLQRQVLQQDSTVVPLDNGVSRTPPFLGKCCYVASIVEGRECTCPQHNPCAAVLEQENYVPNADNQVPDDAFYKEITELHSTSSHCVPCTMNYNTNFSCAPTVVTPPVTPACCVSQNDYSNSTSTLIDLGDLSTFFVDLIGCSTEGR
ncbi:hypothetical protein RB195_008277 [Necator americanus]|uniref:SLED domain-containing protein n=1 Tax=Necator americanus TaxID=51031 RepID=A0ABR1CMU0_NECAM